MNNCNRQNPRNTTTNRYRVRFFFYCYRTSLKPFQTVHSIRPLAGTMTVHGADIGGGGGLVLYLVIINLLWSTGGFFGKTKVGCPGASR